VVIGYVDDDGTIHDRVVDPLGVEGGRLKGYDHRSDRTRSYAVHRIKSVRAATPED
jgi:predicted DNA-binding transcriptional regulator YafY